jgi:ATP-dependent RNA helicase RhlE
MTFTDLRLIQPLLDALQTEGYTHPTPIQAGAIPPVLEERDLLGCAQTGTGKTAAFTLPILQLLAGRELKHVGSRDIHCLILTPTRELAIQIGESIAAYGRNLPVKHTVIFGGVSQHAQVQALRGRIDILVATPGRLLDLMSQKLLHLHHIEIFVLDEADRMLDMGFIHDVKKVIARLPAKRQNLFFSATMPPEIQKLADTILVEPAKVEVTPVSSTAETIEQCVYFVDRDNKRRLLLDLLRDSSIKNALVFTRTKHGADRVAKDLIKGGVHAEAIHGNKSQNARQRALSNFKDGSTRVLVATDIAARGIDVEGLSHVINYELPNVPESYVHRIGRTGRAGAAGQAIAFCDAEELAYLKDIEKLTKVKVPVVESHPYPMMQSAAEIAKKPETRRPIGRPLQQKRQGPQAPQARDGGGQKKSAGNFGSRNQSPQQPKPAKQTSEQPKKHSSEQPKERRPSPAAGNANSSSENSAPARSANPNYDDLSW